jgi:hypothetical protein
MSVVVSERHKMRRYSLKGAERRYLVRGATDESSAMGNLLAQLGSAVPAAIGGFPILPQDITVDEIETDIWEAVVPYKESGLSGGAPGDFSVNFDISGQTQRIKHAIGYRHFWDPDNVKAKRDSHGAININSDGSVEGVDIIIPFTTLTLNYTVDPSEMNDTYVGTLCRMVGTVNGNDFKGFRAGELLFTRCSGRKRNSEAWDLSFGFGVSENKDAHSTSPIVIGNIDGGSPIEKRGWDYLSVFYDHNPDPAAKIRETVPTNVYICQVYHDSDFSLIGLP